MRYPNGVSAGELSKIGCVDKALISRTLKELTEKGYVCRNPEDKDMARGFRIILGSRGKELSERFESLVYGISRYITENVSAQELSAYYEISERISENIRELTKKDIKSLLELP
jgi:DNA-binding MarR family transcriptional regulator